MKSAPRSPSVMATLAVGIPKAAIPVLQRPPAPRPSLNCTHFKLFTEAALRKLLQHDPDRAQELMEAADSRGWTKLHTDGRRLFAVDTRLVMPIRERSASPTVTCTGSTSSTHESSLSAAEEPIREGQAAAPGTPPGQPPLAQPATPGTPPGTPPCKLESVPETPLRPNHATQEIHRQSCSSVEKMDRPVNTFPTNNMLFAAIDRLGKISTEFQEPCVTALAQQILAAPFLLKAFHPDISTAKDLLLRAVAVLAPAEQHATSPATSQACFAENQDSPMHTEQEEDGTQLDDEASAEKESCALADQEVTDEEVIKMAASLAEASLADGVDAAAHVNSASKHKEYMRFYRSMNTKKVARLHPTLHSKFKDHGARAELFVDYWRVKGNLAKMELLVTKKMELKQKAALKYKLFTREDLMVKFHQNKGYVDLVINDAISHKRFKKDRLDPNMFWYWGIDEETFEMQKERTDTMETSHASEVDQPTAEAMFSDGGVFSSTDVIDVGGLDNKMLADYTSQKTSSITRGKQPGGRGKEGSKAQGGKTGSNTVLLQPTEPWKQAQLQMVKLAKAMGQNEQFAVELETLQCDAGLVQHLKDAALGIAACHKQMGALVKIKSMDRSAFADLFEDAKKLLDDSTDKADFARAYLNVHKRKANPKSSERVAKAKTCAA